MDRKCRRPAHDEPGHGHAQFEESVAEGECAIDPVLGRLFTRLAVTVVDVTVVGMEAVGDQIGESVHQCVQLSGRVARLDPGSSHPDLQIQEDRDGAFEAFHRGRERRAESG